MKTYKSNIEMVTLAKEPSEIPKVKILSQKDAYEYCRQFYLDDIGIYESMFLVMLNRANNTIGWAKISQGGIVGTVIDVRIVSKYCIDSLCSGAIICHNHPSGKLEPSNNDIIVTQKVKNALEVFDIKLMDHIILTEEGFYSFESEGIL